MVVAAAIVGIVLLLLFMHGSGSSQTGGSGRY